MTWPIYSCLNNKRVNDLSPSYRCLLSNPVPDLPTHSTIFVQYCLQYDVAVTFVKLSQKCYRNKEHGKDRVHPMKYVIWTQFCCALFWSILLSVLGWYVWFITHILQGCITGTTVIIWLSQCKCVILKDMVKSWSAVTLPQQNTTKCRSCK